MFTEADKGHDQHMLSTTSNQNPQMGLIFHSFQITFKIIWLKYPKIQVKTEWCDSSDTAFDGIFQNPVPGRGHERVFHCVMAAGCL